MAKKTKGSNLSIEERLEQALIPNWDEPYNLPKNWCWAKFLCCSNIRTGKKDANYGSEDGEYPFFTCAADPIRCNGYSFDCHAILLAGNGDIGNISIYDGKFEAYQRTYVVETVGDIDTRYAYYYFKYKWEDYNKDKMFGTAIPYIRLGNLQDFPFPIAPISEQGRIVKQIESLFVKLDEAKEKAQEVVDGFETRKAAILHKAFSGELTAKWREENEKQYSDWENSPLSQIATVVSGFAFSSGDFEPQNTVPCIKITNVGVGEYLPDEYEFLPEAFLKEYPKFIVNQGDILISLTRSYINAGLKVCISQETKPSLLNQRVAMIKNCNIRYIYYFLRSDKVLSYVKEKSKTTNQPNLSIKDLNNLIVPIACPEEQAEIVKLLDYFVAKEQQAKESAEAVIEQIDTMKKAILARAFRGELGTNDPNEESAVELLKQII